MKLTDYFPIKILNKIDPYVELAEVSLKTKNPKVLFTLAPSAIKGMFFKREDHSIVKNTYDTYFDWKYNHDNPAMLKLYQKAKALQWDNESLPWDS